MNTHLLTANLIGDTLKHTEIHAHNLFPDGVTDLGVLSGVGDHDSVRKRNVVFIGIECNLSENIIILSHLHIVPFTFVLALLIDMNHSISKRPFDVTTFIKVVLVQYITRCDQSVSECH
jgi:hypothetical protein